jgi:organic radical activating enzyme
MKQAFLEKLKPDYKLEKKIKELEKYYPEWPFSTKAWSFPIKEKDWVIIRKKVNKVQIAITNKCNFPCKICYSNSLPNDYSMEMSKTIFMKILKKIGRGKRVILIGGEPTVREDIFDLVEMVRKSGNFPEIYTNGIKLADFSFAEELVKRGVKRVYFSFDGFDKNYYKTMNGSENVLFYKLLALKNLMKLNTSVILSSRIVKGLNEREVKRIIDFCIKARKNDKNIVGVYFYGATMYGRFGIENGEMGWYDLYKLIEESTNSVANLEYFIEMKKFILPLHKIGKRLGVLFPFGSGGFIGIFQIGSIKKIMEIDELKKINNELEKGEWLSFLQSFHRFLIKDKQIFKNLFYGFISHLPLEYFIPSRYILIGFGNVNTPVSFSPHSFEAPELFSVKGKFSTPIFVRYYSYSRTQEST